MKLVYKDHPRDQQTVVLIHRWSLYAGSITWKVYPWGLVKCSLYKQVVFIYRWSLDQVRLYINFFLVLCQYVPCYMSTCMLLFGDLAQTTRHTHFASVIHVWDFYLLFSGLFLYVCNLLNAVYGLKCSHAHGCFCRRC